MPEASLTWVSFRDFPKRGALIARVQITALESRKLPEPTEVVNVDRALFHGEQLQFTQLPQHAIDVNGGQTQRVGKNGLAEWALELGWRENESERL